MKKTLLMLLCALLLCGLCLSVSALPGRDVTTETEIAEALETLGLFCGVADGDYDLDRAPSRLEALVMLVRALGKEDEALKEHFDHPFTDVPAWATDYVGYAFKNGLTNGMSSGVFGDGPASAATYLTFMLRALGYSDVQGDFTWDDPFLLAKSLGILPDYTDLADFRRADMVSVSYAALSAPLKGERKTLADRLIAEGAIKSRTYAEEGGKTFDRALLPEDYTAVYPEGYDYTDAPSRFVRPGQYTNLTVTITAPAVTNTEVEAKIEADRQYHASLVKVDRKAKAGDTVAIDYIGILDGVKFDGGTGSADALVLGSGKMIPGFEAGVVGMTPGETRVIGVTFPEDYGNADLAGKAVQFTITLKTVSESVVPALNADYVKEFYDLDSVAAYRESVREELETAREAGMKERTVSELIAAVMEKATFLAYPGGVVDDAVLESLNYARGYAAVYGLDTDTFLQLAAGVTAAGYERDARASAEQGIRENLLLAAIAEAMGLRATDADVDEEIALYVGQAGMASAEEFFAAVGMTEEAVRMKLKNSFAISGAVELLAALNTVEYK